MASNSQLRGKSIGEIFEEVAAWTTNLNVSHPICLKCCACGRGTGVGIDTRRHEVAKSGPKIPYARISHFGADVFQSICIEIGNYFCWFCWVLFTSFPAVCIFLWLISHHFASKNVGKVPDPVAQSGRLKTVCVHVCETSEEM